jgi:hypothetical protein
LIAHLSHAGKYGLRLLRIETQGSVESPDSIT